MEKRIKLSIALVCALVVSGFAQDVAVSDSVSTAKRVKLDGVAAVIGDYVILDSDIENTLIDLQSQGASPEDITHCQ